MPPLVEPAESMLAVHRFMPFDIRLGHDVKTVAVAKIVPESMVRIMARAHGVEIVALHKLNIPDHLVERHGSSVNGTRFMTVYTSELDFSAVHVNRVADNFLILETDAAHTYVVALSDDERIEIRLLRAPKARLKQELKSGIG